VTVSDTHRIPAQSRHRHGDPFDLNDEAAYRAWRARKLACYPTESTALVVRLDNPAELSMAERTAILDRLLRCNMVIYELAEPARASKDMVRALGRQFGLERLDSNLYADEDAVSALQVIAEGRRGEYIPYTNQRLSWHTDGYYNPTTRQIRAIVMHCVSDAARGGESALLDHEVAYILLRDEDPRYVAALMEPDVMTIPANVEGGVELRAAQTGPVFSLDPASASLHMRYSARARNIVWKDGELVAAARERLTAILSDERGYVLRHRLRPGQGIICNNVLHNRTGFEDDPQHGHRRLLYRARYFDRIRGTECAQQQVMDWDDALVE